MTLPGYTPGGGAGVGQPRWNPITPVKTAAYTAAPWDFALFDCTTAVVSQPLPVGAPVGSMFMAKRVDAANTSLTTTGSLAIVPPSGETIRNGLTTNTSLPITGQDQSRMFIKESATQWTAIVDDPLPSLYPRFPRTLGTQVSIKSGDTLQAATIGTTETAFASTLVIPPNTLSAGYACIAFVSGSYQLTNLGPTQAPRIRVGPSATAATSRALANYFGPLNGLLATSTPYLFSGYAMYTCDSLSGTTAVMRSSARLEFVSQNTGQATPFLAGGAPGAYSTFTVDPTIANLITMTTQFSAGTASNYTILQQFLMLGAQAATGST